MPLGCKKTVVKKHVICIMYILFFLSKFDVSWFSNFFFLGIYWDFFPDSNVTTSWRTTLFISNWKKNWRTEKNSRFLSKNKKNISFNLYFNPSFHFSTKCIWYKSRCCSYLNSGTMLTLTISLNPSSMVGSL